MENNTNEHGDAASIVVPERLSVKDLRAWLTNFGQANKQHYEKGRLLKQQQVAIQSRIQSLEDVLGSPSSYANSSSNNSQVPAGQLTWESPVKPTLSTEPAIEPKTPPFTVEEQRTTNSPQKSTKDAMGCEFGDEEEREQPSPNSVMRASFKEPIDALVADPLIEAVTLNQNVPTEDESSWDPPSELEQGIEILTLMEESTPSTDADYYHDASKQVEPPRCPTKPSVTSPSSSSKIYRFEPVRQRPRMRVVGVERLLEPPVPTRRANDTWEDDYEDEWADDFSEPCFPQARHARMNLETTAAVSAWKTPDVRPQVGYSVDSDGYEDDDDDDEDLLDSVSIATGRYTDPGSRHHPQHFRRPKTRKNRFPLWLCHKRKHAVPYDEEPEDHYFPDDDDNDTGHFEMQVQVPPVPTPATLYESPPRPKEAVHPPTNFLPDGVLTKSTLDLLCRPNDQEYSSSSSSSLFPTATSTNTNVLPNIVEQGNVVSRQEVDVSSRRSSSSTTTATSSNNSRDAPAILPGAVQDPLRYVLSRDNNNNNRIATAVDQWGGSSVTNNNKRNKYTVAQRRRQLQQALDRDKPISHVKRIQWQVCPKTGLYKKKIIVEPSSSTTFSSKSHTQK